MDKKAAIKEAFEWIYCVIIAVALALVIRYYDKTDYELITLTRFMRREFGKEN